MSLFSKLKIVHLFYRIEIFIPVKMFVTQPPIISIYHPFFTLPVNRPDILQPSTFLFPARGSVFPYCQIVIILAAEHRRRTVTNQFHPQAKLRDCLDCLMDFCHT